MTKCQEGPLTKKRCTDTTATDANGNTVHISLTGRTIFPRSMFVLLKMCGAPDN